jgi:hypothetical protein
VSEAGKVERDDVVVVAQRLVDRLPADSGLSYPVQQDQWLARSGPMMGEIVGGGRRQAGRDGVSLVGRTASEHRDPSNSHRQPHYSPDGLVGGRSLERRDNPGPASARHSSCRDPVRHARLTEFGRLLLVQRLTELGWPPALEQLHQLPVEALALALSVGHLPFTWNQC